MFSLIVCAGNCAKNRCDGADSCLEIGPRIPAIAVFPAKFPVCRESARRRARSPLRRLPALKLLSSLCKQTLFLPNFLARLEMELLMLVPESTQNSVVHYIDHIGLSLWFHPDIYRGSYSGSPADSLGVRVAPVTRRPAGGAGLGLGYRDRRDDPALGDDRQVFGPLLLGAEVK